ncbi:MAG: hypothetical protein RJA34_2682 [Pseudomonadota bacterium]
MNRRIQSRWNVLGVLRKSASDWPVAIHSCQVNLYCRQQTRSDSCLMREIGLASRQAPHVRVSADDKYLALQFDALVNPATAKVSILAGLLQSIRRLLCHTNCRQTARKPTMQWLPTETPPLNNAPQVQYPRRSHEGCQRMYESLGHAKATVRNFPESGSTQDAVQEMAHRPRSRVQDQRALRKHRAC